MSEPPRDRAAEMRAAFDASFAAPVSPPPPSTVDVLRVRAGGVPYQLALVQVASLHADLRIVPVPSPARALLGVVAVRGTVVPVYDLASALGATANPSAPRWVAVARGGAAGIAFGAFDGHARVTTAQATIDLVALVRTIEKEHRR